MKKTDNKNKKKTIKIVMNSPQVMTTQHSSWCCR